MLRKLVLIFLLVTALALGLIILFTEKPGYPEWMQNGLAVAAIAIAAALGSRFTLKKRNGFIRFLAAAAALAAGLYILGAASGWKYGIGPFVTWPRTWDWDAIAQLSLGVYLVFLALAAWRRRAPKVPAYAPQRQIEPMLREIKPGAATYYAPPAPRKKPVRSTPRTSRKLPAPAADKKPAAAARQAVAPRAAAAVIRPAPPLRPAVPSQPALKVKRGNKGNGKVRTITAADFPKARKPRRGGRKAAVQFAVVEDHRCPFCLDPVSRADPRGVVECEVCHALHHKDCWDITGFCQVPHLNS